MAFNYPACTDEWFRDCDPCLDDGPLCCDEHIPALIACDICFGGGTVTSTAAPLTGTDPNQVCCVGGVFQYAGASTLLDFTGPTAIPIDTVVVLGQNAGQVSSAFGATLTDCQIGQGKFVPAPVVQLGGGGLVSNTFTVALSAGGATGCVERVIVGKRVELPEGLRVGAQDPWSGTSIVHEVEMSQCCRPLHSTLKRMPMPLQLKIDCISEEFYKTVWLPYIHYAARRGVVFMPSVNRCPWQVFVGWIESPQAGTWYSSFDRTITINARGYTENLEKQ